MWKKPIFSRGKIVCFWEKLKVYGKDKTQPKIKIFGET